MKSPLAIYILETNSYEGGTENHLEIHVKMDPDYGHDSKLHCTRVITHTHMPKYATRNTTQDRET